MKAFLEEYGLVIVIIVVVLALILIANFLGDGVIKEGLSSIVDSFSTKMTTGIGSTELPSITPGE